MSGFSSSRTQGDRQPLSAPFVILGWLSCAVAFALDLRLIYEQTVLTWTNGPQMLGFAVAHLHPELLIIGGVGIFCAHAWLLICLVIYIRRRMAHRTSIPSTAWIQIALLAIAAAAPYVPYSLWQFISLQMEGPGHKAIDQL